MLLLFLRCALVSAKDGHWALETGGGEQGRGMIGTRTGFPPLCRLKRDLGLPAFPSDRRVPPARRPLRGRSETGDGVTRDPDRGDGGGGLARSWEPPPPLAREFARTGPPAPRVRMGTPGARGKVCQPSGVSRKLLWLQRSPGGGGRSQTSVIPPAGGESGPRQTPRILTLPP